MKKVFEERFVVFIDILGFSSMVSKASCCDIEAKRVDAALERIQRLELATISDFRSHIFSDCVYMSVPVCSELVSKLFIELMRLTVDLMEQGVWVRGGLTLGNIAQRVSTPWGPALVKAHGIESQVAKYPRLALSTTAYKYTKDRMHGKVENRLIERDKEDGVWALTPFTWALKEDYLTKERGSEIKSRLDDARRETVDNPRVYKKIDWLCSAWSSQVGEKYPEFKTEYYQSFRMT